MAMLSSTLCSAICDLVGTVDGCCSGDRGTHSEMPEAPRSSRRSSNMRALIERHPLGVKLYVLVLGSPGMIATTSTQNAQQVYRFDRTCSGRAAASRR